MASTKKPTSPETEASTPAWESPWPYDVPPSSPGATGGGRGDRVSGIAGSPPLRVTRRKVFGAAIAGWGAFAAAGGVGALALVRFLFPNTSFEPPQIFKTAPKETFAPETVDETWKDAGVWVVNTEGRIMAISTVCTHLGCTPNWLPGEKKFKCPCHGSGYYINGVNFEGPTPRPLERFAVTVDPTDGMVVVDKTLKCQVEQGTCEAAQYFLPA
jgi:cytochrome b6-f complex iron-sulfur subunit